MAPASRCWRPAKMPSLFSTSRGRQMAKRTFSRFSSSTLSTVPVEGGPPHPVGGAHWDGIRDLPWLPGSRHVVLAGGRGVSSSQLYEVPVEGGEARQITHDLSHYEGVRASADGKTLLALQHQILATLQVITPGKESEARSLSAGNQNLDGAQLGWHGRRTRKSSITPNRTDTTTFGRWARTAQTPSGSPT